MLCYQYMPLQKEPKDIRLLHLLPGEGSSPIQASIIHKPLCAEDAPYEALSYAWGDPERTHTISISPPSPTAVYEQAVLPEFQCRQSSLRITKNLSIALQHLRHPEDIRVLWIDAICIDQDNLSERSEEVANMASSYTKASRVIVWLGEESPTSSLAVKTFKSLSQDIDEAHLEIYNPTTARDGSETSKLQSDDDACRARVLDWIAIRKLVQRPWFSRLWILQEIAHASCAVIKIGSEEISWGDFSKTSAWLCTHIPKTFIAKIIDKDDWNRVMHLIRKYIVNGEPMETLEQLLTRTKYQSCLDRRDRIYAILSLACKRDTIGIKPDYSKETKDVYKDFVLGYMKNSGTLRLFNFCRQRNDRYALVMPSWVPDFSTPHLVQDFPYLRNATGCSEQQSHFDPVGDRLKVCGVIVGTVNHVTSAISSSARLAEILAVCKSWASQFKFRGIGYVAGGTLSDAFISTLICGLCGPPEITGGGHGLSLAGSRTAFEECVIMGKEGESGSDIQKYTYLLGRYLPGQALFRTGIATDTTMETGYIGLCPAGTRPGDQVVVILGCNSPCVLRPKTDTPGTYILIGPCYGHGLMNSEALLGPLKNGWKISGVYNRGVSYAPPPRGLQCRWRRYFWMERKQQRDDKCDTFNDPRLGPLPIGWKAIEGDKPSPMSESMAPSCGLKTLLFEPPNGQPVTRFDPRLTSDALKERGVGIRDFILGNSDCAAEGETPPQLLIDVAADAVITTDPVVTCNNDLTVLRDTSLSPLDPSPYQGMLRRTKKLQRKQSIIEFCLLLIFVVCFPYMILRFRVYSFEFWNI